jgi:hypothetical protein
MMAPPIIEEQRPVNREGNSEPHSLRSLLGGRATDVGALYEPRVDAIRYKDLGHHAFSLAHLLDFVLILPGPAENERLV